MQAAKKVYESLLGDGSNSNSLSHIQVRSFRFLREVVMSRASKYEDSNFIKDNYLIDIYR